MISIQQLFVNGKFRSMDSARNVHEAMLVEGDLIRAVGSEQALRTRTAADVAVIDLGGRTVLPGLVDSHTHVAGSAVSVTRDIDFDVLKPSSLGEVCDAIRERVARTQPGEWIFGIHLRWPDLAERRFPDRRELDAIAPDNPVVLSDHGNHKLAVNSRSLEIAGIDRNTPAPEGGSIEHFDDGEPSGILNERGKLRLHRSHPECVLPVPTPEQHRSAISEVMDLLAGFGITCIYDMLTSPQQMKAYQVMRRDGVLPIRVRANLRGIESDFTLRDILNLGLQTGLGDKWLRLGAVKMSVDGSDSAHNAALYREYPDEPGNEGLIRIEQDELTETVQLADANGLQVAIHAIGQRAVDMALDAIEHARTTNDDSGLLHRIEHAYQPPINKQLERMKELGVIWSTQAVFYYEEGEYMTEVFEEGAEEFFFSLRRGLDLGIPINLNSDYACASPNPFLGIYTAVNRRSVRGVQLGKEQIISVDDAIAMMTVGCADAMSSENKIGSLEAGNFADFVVLDRDPYEIDPEDIKNTTVLSTTAGGILRYGSYECSKGNVL